MSHKLKSLASAIGGQFVSASSKATASEDGDFTPEAVSALRSARISVRTAGDAWTRLGTGSLWISPRNGGNDFEIGITHPAFDTSIKLESKPMSKLTPKTASGILKIAKKLDEAVDALVAL